MMHGIRNLLWLAPLLLLLGWPLYGGALKSFLAPPELRKSVPAARDEGLRQRFVMEEVRLYQDLAGARQWRIDTPRLRTGQESDELLLAAVEAVLFREGQEHLFIVADRGRYDTGTETLYLDGNVQLREPGRFRLATPALSYHEREGLVRSRAGVEIVTDDLRVQGRNLDYDLAAGRYLLTGKVLFISH